MYHHVKKLMFTVRVDEPDPRFGNMLLEQFGGANGELAAAMQYSIQGLNCEDSDRKDLLMDIGTEELSHLEVVGTLARMHLKPAKFDRQAAEADPLIAIAGGGGVNLFNSQGNPWTADYLKITGELDVDLRSNIAAEARAKIVYERLLNFTGDAGTRDALQFLMTREVTHMRAFTAALETLGKPRFAIGKIPPTTGLVDALPKLAQAAHAHPLKLAFETHLQETRFQVDRLGEAFKLVGVSADTERCKGMAGLIEESQEVIDDGADMEDGSAADLALIA